MKKCLITGILGFVASNLALELQKRYPDAEIVGYDNLLSGDFRNLEGFKGEFISNFLELYPTCYGDGLDILFHLGSNTDTTNSNLKEQLSNNVNLTRNLLEIIKPKQIIYASSASVYGVGATKPSVETDDLKPANAYAFSKVQLERLMLKYAPNSIGFRFFNVYGRNEQHKGISTSMVTQILKKVKNNEDVALFRDGNQVRDFIYVDDVVNLLIAAAEKPVAGIFNCGTGQTASFNQIFKVSKEFYPNSASEIKWIENPYKTFFQDYTEASVLKVCSTFDWKPKYPNLKGMFYYKDLV